MSELKSKQTESVIDAVERQIIYKDISLLKPYIKNPRNYD